MAASRHQNGDDDGLEQNVIRIGRRLGNAFNRKLSGIIILIVLVILGYSSYYQIEPEEVGLITRFGAYTATAQPGPHFKIPIVESVYRVPIKRQLKEEFGFRSRPGATQTEYVEGSDVTDQEARMLTGDLNVADVEWIVQYRIADAYKFVFNVRNVRTTLRDMAESSVRKVVGDHSVSEVLTIGREAVQIKAKEELQRIANRYGAGIRIEQLVLQDVNPPKAVRASFNEVNQAIQERERVINQAWAQYNSVIPKARGSAAQTVQSAEGYATERVNRAQGEVARFLALQEEYEQSPVVTRSRLYLETLADVVPRAKHRVFIDDRLKGLLPILSLNASGVPKAPEVKP